MCYATICAIVVTYNRLEKFRRTLERLLNEPVDHILVVENGSTDGTREWLAGVKDNRLTVLEQAVNGGGARGFEVGMREACSRFDPDWYLVMDDDARPRPSAIAAFRRTLPRPEGAVLAAVFFPDGRICDMNRPWRNPFWHLGVFCDTFLKLGGRRAFHISDAAYHADTPLPVDGGSFVGLFIPRAGVERCGYPDGRMFIYGDDVHYTLRLAQVGLPNHFEPQVQFEHECSTELHGAAMTPYWKTYYHHRNLYEVYRVAVGPVLFWPLMLTLLPRWLFKGRDLPRPERQDYRALIRLAILDALRGKLDRPHSEILARSRRHSSS
ncbi:glycosyltransferase (plasmid) [Cereibacter azotoformans]|uniref:glycosyltransferase n=1 Tax=Cereibacter azotoformans TaxID=43057 RepID=UPI001EE9D39C|nr:glycosyltransferase [Cereibacter azotoformans]ULB12044.1 glycosyltransferase [Cereibacter azotoformans]